MASQAERILIDLIAVDGVDSSKAFELIEILGIILVKASRLGVAHEDWVPWLRASDFPPAIRKYAADLFPKSNMAGLVAPGGDIGTVPPARCIVSRLQGKDKPTKEDVAEAILWCRNRG